MGTSGCVGVSGCMGADRECSAQGPGGYRGIRGHWGAPMGCRGIKGVSGVHWGW